MAESLYIDLWIVGEDLSLDAGGVPERCNNRLSIAQDIKHALLESGLVTLLIAERSKILRKDIILQMILLIEEDERLVPGTIEIIERDLSTLIINAETVEWGNIYQQVTLNEQ
ncbi:phage protein [[Actinobacillus] muris]|uniref:Phage protein n=1 Tax=Muribacter muris TaxID=67855 RepID=A0A0J5S3U5_9PAST|nr:DUF2590 family protein [Muribacter muris]KMK51467.1 phage protein [[Actinobacillus] muris] [Muribacter muris]